MPSPISVACPNCEATLKLKSREAEGKKVRCPKCEKPFVVKLPAVEDEVVDEWDLPTEDDADEEPPPPPVRKGAGKKKKKSRSGGFQKPALIVGAALVAVAMIGGLITGAIYLLPLLQSGNRIDLAYLPEDVESVAVIRVADIWNSPLVQKLKTNPMAVRVIEQMQTESSLTPADVVTMTVAMPKPPAGARSMTFEEGFKLGQTNPGVTVMRMSRPYDSGQFTFVGQKGLPAEHNGTSYLRAPPRQLVFITSAAWFPNSTTVVVGPENAVKAAIDRGAKSARHPGFDFVDPSQHILFVHAPRNLAPVEQRKASPAAPGTPAVAQKLTESLDLHGDAVWVGVKFGEGVDVQVQVKCPGDDAAGKMKVSLEESLKAAKDQFTMMKVILPPAFTDLGDKFLASITTTQTGAIVQMTGSIPSTVAHAIDAAGGTQPGAAPTTPVPAAAPLAATPAAASQAPPPSSSAPLAPSTTAPTTPPAQAANSTAPLAPPVDAAPGQAPAAAPGQALVPP